MEINKKQLIASFLHAFQFHQGFYCHLRPKGIKFDEGKAKILLDLQTYKGISIGDQVTIESLWYEDNPREVSRCKPFEKEYALFVVAFVEMTGHFIKKKGAYLREIYCILASISKRGIEMASKGEISISEFSIVIQDDKKNRNLIYTDLFWAHGLKKVEE